MTMPWQLREGLKRRPKGSRPPRPIAEQLPQISVNDLQIPRDYRTYTAPNISLKYPQIAALRMWYEAVEFHHPSLHRGQNDPTQIFQIKRIKTGFGIRHAFICATCKRPVIKLYYRHQHLACRRCQDAIYASQSIDQYSRPVLQASRIQSF